MSEERLARDARLLRAHRVAQLGGPPMSERDWNDYLDMRDEYRDGPEPDAPVEEPSDE